ncbi:MAG: Do family serine endopeptidase [Tannerella sp.]|jgi:Do/DeqQ family serine protease|nr:Do family serine endopeptidase [Tannerella sp.]
MKTMWKKVFVVVVVAVVSFITSIGAVTYMVKHNKGIQAALIEEDVFKQPLRLTNYASVAAENTDFTYAAEQAIHAVVHIKSMAKAQASKSDGQYFDPFEFFFGYRGNPHQPQPRVGFGSGVIISTDGYILTNNHVIEGADELEVTLNDNREFRAKIIGADPTTDIALLKIEAADLKTLPFGDSEQLKIGEWVLAVGNPFSFKSTVTAGIVSAKGRAIMTGSSDRNKVESFIQTDAAVNPGNSGGALVNTKGELIGINTAIYSETGNFAGYSFAVPISIAGKVVADLKQYGAVQRAILGVMINNAQDAKHKDDKIKVLEGAYVSEFAPRSSAKEAGVEVGDVITAVNDVKVKSSNALQEQINKYRPGDKVKVEVDRYGTKKVFTVELRNAQGGTEVVAKSGNSAELLGAAFRELTDAQKKEYGVSYGIEVNGVSKGKIQEAGIRKGFIIMIVNDRKISTSDELYQIVDRILKGGSEDQGLFIKGFYPSGRTQHYAIDLIE